MLALLVPITLGIRDLLRPVLPFLGPRVGAPAASSDASYPREPAEAYAVRFALAYETYDSAHVSRRQQALKQFLPTGADPTMGWDGVGSQTAYQGLAAGIDILDAQRSAVTVAVLVDNGRWIYLSVPVFADQGGYAVTGEPALVPPPASAVTRPSVTDVLAPEDTVLAAQLRPSMEAFFAAYAHSDATQLSYYASPGVSFMGLGGAVDFVALQDLTASSGPANQSTAKASVRWRDSVTGAGLLHVYQLHLVQAGGKWLVSDLSPNR